MPDRRVQESGTPGETEAIAAALAHELRPGDLVLVAGELGAGKTTFVRGGCRALGVHGPVTSPTFTIGARYHGRVEVAHLDLFRLESLAGEDPALLADYLRPDTVAFVEWPERASWSASGAAPVARVLLEHLGGDRRRVTVTRTRRSGADEDSAA